jgi:hypothetical protein
MGDSDTHSLTVSHSQNLTLSHSHSLRGSGCPRLGGSGVRSLGVSASQPPTHPCLPFTFTSINSLPTSPNRLPQTRSGAAAPRGPCWSWMRAERGESGGSGRIRAQQGGFGGIRADPGDQGELSPSHSHADADADAHAHSPTREEPGLHEDPGRRGAEEPRDLTSRGAEGPVMARPWETRTLTVSLSHSLTVS